jgi:hypothetical protein
MEKKKEGEKQSDKKGRAREIIYVELYLHVHYSA